MYKLRDLGRKQTLPSPCTVCVVSFSQIGTCGSQISAVSNTASEVARRTGALEASALVDEGTHSVRGTHRSAWVRHM